jgi:glycosyltransferase involved in cell wall biosynthesis
MKSKLVFISNMASPHQVKFCYALQEYFDAEFWFHVQIENNRQNWWGINLGNKCKILNKVLFKKFKKYLSLDIIKELKRFNPDIIILGGFTLISNVFSYIWGVKNNKRIILYSEINRTKKNKIREKGLYTFLIKKFYYKCEMIFASSIEAKIQFEKIFKFKCSIYHVPYATDLDGYFNHQLRNKKIQYNILFPNRLTDIYNPLQAIEIFKILNEKSYELILYMNAAGEMRGECERYINEYKLTNKIVFLDNINSWNEMKNYYKKCDIMILPAKFSAGNFTIIEAMASGMGIVISNKIMGSGNYIRNNINGFKCELNSNEFVFNIEKYIKNPDLFIIHGKINKKYAKKFSTENIASLYNILIGNK